MILFIHGMWCQGQHLQPLAAQFKGFDADIHTPTLPQHHAHNDGQVGAQSLQSYVDFLVAYVKNHNPARPPLVVGHSMGGLLAQMLADRIPVRALVLLTPASPAGINPLTPRVLLAGLPIFSRWGFWQKSHRLSYASFCQHATAGLSQSKQRELYGTLVAESGLVASEIAFWWWFGQSKVSKLTTPIYVVAAGNDGLVPASVVRKVAARYPNSTLRVWPDRSHWVIDDDDSPTMVKEILSWLRNK
jgi:pimeloyl-ACP methyl ester carboxylesterase